MTMTKIALAVAAGLVLGACATTNNGSPAAATPVSGTQYCWQERLDTSGGKLTCNWAASRREACDSRTFTSVDAGRYAAPKKASMCANGQWLVEVVPAG
jgi:hypothetical protein